MKPKIINYMMSTVDGRLLTARYSYRSTAQTAKHISDITLNWKTSPQEMLS